MNCHIISYTTHMRSPVVVMPCVHSVSSEWQSVIVQIPAMSRLGQYIRTVSVSREVVRTSINITVYDPRIELVTVQECGLNMV